LQLPLEIRIHELPDGSGAVEEHKSFGKHLIKLIYQSVSP